MAHDSACRLEYRVSRCRHGGKTGGNRETGETGNRDSTLNHDFGKPSSPSATDTGMSRIARLLFTGVPYHITQRGNGRQQIFFDGSSRSGGREAANRDPDN